MLFEDHAKVFFSFFFFFSDSGPERSIISIETVLFCHETPSLEYQGDKVLQTQIPPLHQYYLFLHQIVRRTWHIFKTTALIC